MRAVARARLALRMIPLQTRYQNFNLYYDALKQLVPFYVRLEIFHFVWIVLYITSMSYIHKSNVVKCILHCRLIDIQSDVTSVLEESN